MGTYLNPGNHGFATIREDRYVDKSGLIGLINQSIDTPRKLTCVSRPRRFGKSYAAKMLCAYYDRSCDSSDLFDDLKVAQSEDYLEHRNQYNVIYLDMITILGETRENKIRQPLIPFIVQNIKKELKKEWADMEGEDTLITSLIRAVQHSGRKFIMLIDEWDAPIREVPEYEEDYLQFLRMLFKGSGTTDRIFAAVYMTGILPVKKGRSQSAMSDFKEYTMLRPQKFDSYIGFTEEEVRSLCQKYEMDFQSMKFWYDGYHFQETSSIYNPNSVMEAIRNEAFDSYWVQTSAAESLLTWIDMDEDGLQEDVTKLIGGETIEVDPDGFENDFQTFRDKNDVFTLMVHLGYLNWQKDEDGIGYAGIPNEEIRREFHNILRKGKHHELIRLVRESDELLQKTIAGDGAAVAAAIAKVHDSNYAPQYYNDEQALRSTIRMAYLSCVDQYLKIEELPSGHGLADLVFLPKRRSLLPAILIELKWNQAESAALAQIRNRNYPAVLKKFGGEIVLVGITYDAKTKEHHCEIERLEQGEAAS